LHGASVVGVQIIQLPELKAGLLFPEIASPVKDFSAANPEASLNSPSALAM